MSKIQQLLFSNMDNFNLDEVSRYPLSVASLLANEKRKDVEKIHEEFDKTILQENSKKCEPFRKSAAERKRENAKQLDSLKDWFGFKKVELSKEDEADIEILRRRNHIDPKNAIKNADNLNNAYIQIGTIVSDPIHGRSDTLKRKERKNRIYEQFIEDDKRIGLTKRKFQEIQTEKMNNSRNKKWIKLKRLKMAKKTLTDDVREMKF